jgi:hypothetical protein
MNEIVARRLPPAYGSLPSANLLAVVLGLGCDFDNNRGCRANVDFRGCAESLALPHP